MKNSLNDLKVDLINSVKQLYNTERKKSIKNILEVKINIEAPNPESRFNSFFNSIKKDYNDIIPPTRPILLNGINKEFKYIEETLGNSLGVAIGMAMSQTRPIWVNVSDSTFLMGRTLEALKIIKKFNLNIFITVDCNKYTRASKDKNLDIEIYRICEAYRFEVFSTCSNYPNNFNEEFEKVLPLTTPRVMIINTIKGDGFKEFEDDPIGWHYRKLTEKDYCRIYHAKDNPSTFEHEHLIEYIN